ncbi:hypothetical protein CLF_106999 [Clonorchis sinensis]|uniref:Reverse transcriptase domain-containing protein n=1 Tax=Clonorchis sinensis TaxID=79923 RepID=G7YG25_CLOSI|nr:hypothetical protein CLF_106999 [Clonorchis sinensis]
MGKNRQHRVGPVASGIMHVSVHSRSTSARRVIGGATKKVSAAPKNQKSFDSPISNTVKKQSYKKRPQSRSVFATFQVEFESRRKYLTVSINKVPIRLQLDTASDITLISRSNWELIGKPVVSLTNHRAQSASGSTLLLTGKLACNVSFNNVQFSGTCYLTECPNLNILGLDWIEKLNLFSVPLSSVCSALKFSSSSDIAEHFTKTLKTTFNDVFQSGLGCCTKTKASLKLQPGSTPIFRPKRPVPFAALATVENELFRLQQSGVIQPVNYSSWAAPIVVIKKANGKVRICADYSTGLNAVLGSHQYPLPVPEDLFTKLNGGKCFAKLDLADAYLQIEVSDDSKELLTINTHRGLFQFNRLPFGVKSAPAIFQQTMDAMLNGLSGVAAYLDDIILTGSNQEELLHRLHCVLERIQQYGFRLRAEKCAFFSHFHQISWIYF